MRSFNENVEQCKRNRLKGLYLQCSEKQQKFFNRLWGSVDNISEDKIHMGVSQLERTIEINTQRFKE